MSTAYHPQSDGQTENTNKILEDMLRHWVNPSQDNWDSLLDTAEFAINNAFQSSIQTTPFRLNYGFDPYTPLSIAVDSKQPVAKEFVHHMRESLKTAKLALKAAQDRQKTYYDAGRTAQHFDVGQKVLLRSTNLQFKGTVSRKLLPKWIGPFMVTRRVGELAYQLDVPPTLPVHNVFHTVLLRPFHDNGRHQPPPQPIEINGALEYEVEQILGHRLVKRGRKTSTEYLINWRGQGPEYNTWEPEDALRNSQELLAEFKAKAPLPERKPRPRKIKDSPATASAQPKARKLLCLCVA